MSPTSPSCQSKLKLLSMHVQGRSHRCGRCGHGRTTFRSTNARSKVTQVSFPYGTQTRLPDCIHTWSIMAVKPEDIGDLPLEPFQPMHIAFPSRSFRKSAPVNRSFQATWFNKFAWLHYDVAQDAARCFTCCKAVKGGRAVP